MFITEITEENLEEYEAYLPGDVAENIGRPYYRGVAVTQDEAPQAAIVWEWRHKEDEEKSTEGRLEWLRAEDSDAGSEVLAEYARMAADEGAERTFYSLPQKECEALGGLLKEAGFSEEKQEGQDIVLTVGQFMELDVMKHPKVPDYVKSLEELRSRSFRRGLMDCVYHVHRDLPEDLTALSLDWYDLQVSCYEELDDNVNGFLLVHRTASGKLRLDLLADWGPDARLSLVYLMRHAILKASEVYPADTQVVLHRHDDSSYKLAAYLFPNAKGEACLGGERKEEGSE
ncbi:MAG: hypothetical protein IKO11_02260 [Lachnospiraceae bacterium]|nr:hypothetical protein [Lachnospiraceae bacterium]MBR6325580.1 hypothetical protein [Lachnospiraceae bacterium]